MNVLTNLGYDVRRAARSASGNDVYVAVMNTIYPAMSFATIRPVGAVVLRSLYEELWW